MGTRAAASENHPAMDALRRQIPEPILAHYDRLRARGKRGVALVRHGVCSGCQMKLATGVHAALLRDDDIAMCDSCARYLLVAPGQPSPALRAGAATQESAGEARTPEGFAGRRRLTQSPASRSSTVWAARK